MRVVSFSGDLYRNPKAGERLSNALVGEPTIIDLSGVTHFSEAFANDLFLFLKRSIKSDSRVVLVAQGKTARKLRVYGFQCVVHIVDDRDSAIKFAAA